MQHYFATHAGGTNIDLSKPRTKEAITASKEKLDKRIQFTFTQYKHGTEGDTCNHDTLEDYDDATRAMAKILAISVPLTVKKTTHNTQQFAGCSGKEICLTVLITTGPCRTSGPLLEALRRSRT